MVGGGVNFCFSVYLKRRKKMYIIAVLYATLELCKIHLMLNFLIKKFDYEV